MNKINRTHRIVGLLIIVLVSALALAANVDSTNDPFKCLTKEDVIRAQERSLSGISLVCNEAIRESKLAR